MLPFLLYGCRGDKSEFDTPYGRFAGAESLRSVRTREKDAGSRELVAEVINLIEQYGMPADVFFGLSSRLSDTSNISESRLTDKEKKDRIKLREIQENNIAVTLYHQFHEYYTLNELLPEDASESEKKQLLDKHWADSDLNKLWEASPIGEWDVNQETLNKMKVTLAKLESRRLEIRNVLEKPKTRFYYVFNRPDSKSFMHTGGMVNTDASKFLLDYALLEEYAVAQALLDGNIEAAIIALEYVFRIAYLASTLENVGARVDAARVRLRAFDVMQRIVLDPKFEKKHMVTLREMLQDEHNNWTPEYKTWFGDRASGVMLYHNILMGGPENALEPMELLKLASRGEYSFRRGFKKYWRADEAFYLQSMQKILDVSHSPLAERLDVLDKIQNELRAREGTLDEEGISMAHYVAGILLHDIDRIMRLLAQDQSALNRALVVMNKSLGLGTTDSYHDPFTDEPYEVRQVEGRFSVSGTMLPRPFRVPIFQSP
jgi:hypothetical protein